MNTTYDVIIPLRLKGERVDFALAQLIPHLSRSKITKSIKDHAALLNGKPFHAKDKVLGGEVIYFSYEPEPTHWRPSEISLDIVFEDADILVINKPVGLVTHPGNGNWEGTLGNALLHYLPELHEVDRAGIVHRLDKDTSGLLVVAKHHRAQQHLITQLATRDVHREYYALCYGHIISGGTIDEPIGRDSRNRLKQAVTESGREAITHYRIVEKFADFTLVKVLLETGRTHQIRVHMSHIGYPLVGDSVYGKGLRLPKHASEELKHALKHFTRQALHAKQLEFIHPISGEIVTFSTNLAEDMHNLLEVIRIHNASC